MEGSRKKHGIWLGNQADGEGDLALPVRPIRRTVSSAGLPCVLPEPTIPPTPESPAHMSTLLTLHAFAKTNLWFRILGRREDNFHEVRTRMTLLSLADDLVFRSGRRKELVLTVEDADWTPEPGSRNLVEQAYDAFAAATGKKEPLQVHLVKRIPSGAGLGGGSSDAAAMLRGLNEITQAGLSPEALEEIAAPIGSDVPFFIRGRISDCSGRGECVVPVDDDWELPVVLFKPGFSVATPDAYGNWADSKEIPGVYYGPQLCPWGEMVNDLERPVFGKFPMLAELKMWLLDQPGVHAALLSGSGSSMVAILSRQDGGEALAAAARDTFGPDLWTYVGQTLASL